MTNILQTSLFTDFLYPFLLMFFISYALLQKSGLFKNQQIDAFVSLVVSLIFVSVVFPVMVVNNLILFMTVGIVVIFVGFMFWGFINGGDLSLNDKVKKWMAVLVLVAVVVALFWSTGAFPSLWVFIERIFNFAFASKGSGSFWTNFLIVVLVVAAVAAVLKAKGFSEGGSH